MKTNLIFISLIFLIIACKKSEEFDSTMVQIHSSDYFTGDSIGNVAFTIKEPYTASSYGITDSTNAYGNYNGSFLHPAENMFELWVSSDFFIIDDRISITNGELNVLEIELIEMSTLTIDLQCTNGGTITSLSRSRVVPFDNSSPLYGREEGLSMYYTTYCGGVQESSQLFCGDWKMTYYWAPNTWTSPTLMTEVITILPGENYVYTIVF